jgi:hypothetical protein
MDDFLWAVVLKLLHGIKAFRKHGFNSVILNIALCKIYGSCLYKSYCMFYALLLLSQVGLRCILSPYYKNNNTTVLHRHVAGMCRVSSFMKTTGMTVPFLKSALCVRFFISGVVILHFQHYLKFLYHVLPLSENNWQNVFSQAQKHSV